MLDGVEWAFVCRGATANPLAAEYTGPYMIVRRSQKVVELQVGDRVETFSADRIKPYSGETPTPALLPKRGRPAGSAGIGSLIATAVRLGEGNVAAAV